MNNLLYRFRQVIKTVLIVVGFDKWGNSSWSQEGEDLILKRIFENQTEGFYIDVGAHHPKRYSNTYSFYRRGWRGINIDAMPGSMNLFKYVRKRDINLEHGVGPEEGSIEYYIFNDAALNGFSKELSLSRDSEKNEYSIVDTIKTPISRLDKILDAHLDKGQSIDFLSVDVEGFDLEVLKSNNWKLYRPKIVIVEVLGSSIEEILHTEIYNFLLSKNYEAIAKTINSVFFSDKST